MEKGCHNSIRELLPFILSIIPPRDSHAPRPLLLKYRYTYTGEKAFKMLLSYFKMLKMPIPPIKRSQRRTTGANSQQTLPVPYCWMTNKSTNMTTATSTTISG